MPIIFADGFDQYITAAGNVEHLPSYGATMIPDANTVEQNTFAPYTGWFMPNNDAIPGSAQYYERNAYFDAAFINSINGDKFLNFVRNGRTDVSKIRLVRKMDFNNDICTIGFKYFGSPHYYLSNILDSFFKISNNALLGPFLNTDAPIKNSMFNLECVPFGSQYVFAVRYNNISYKLYKGLLESPANQVVFTPNESYYFEIQINKNSESGYLKVRLNGVDCLFIQTPIACLPEEDLYFSFLCNSHSNNVTDGNAGFDDVYMSNEDNIFYGPIKINTLRLEQHEIQDFNLNGSSSPMAVLDTNPANFMSCSKSTGKFIAKGVCNPNAIGYLVFVNAKNSISPNPRKLDIVSSNDPNLLETKRECSLSNLFLRHQTLINTAELSGTISQSNLRYFGFKIGDLDQ